MERFKNNNYLRGEYIDEEKNGSIANDNDFDY